MKAKLARLPGIHFSLRTAILLFTAIGAALGVYVSWKTPGVRHTGRQLDWMVEGHGYFMCTHPNGEIHYTRCGNIFVDAHQGLQVGQAKQPRRLEPGISIPSGWQAINISPEGVVTVRTPGSKDLFTVGQIQLARFANPEGLREVARDEFALTPQSGNPVICNPGDGHVGLIRTGFLESSGRIATPAWLPYAVIFGVLGFVLWELRALRYRLDELSNSRPLKTD